MNLNLTDSKGFLVTDVNANSPADKAGIQGGYKVEIIYNTPYTLGGDIIIGIDNKTIYTVQDIKNYINAKNEGDIVNLKVIRNGEIKNIDAKLKVLPITARDAEPFDKSKPFGEDIEEDS
jgi:serine protease Do